MNCFEPTKEDLDQIRDLGAAFTPVSEVALIMDCDEDELRDCMAGSRAPIKIAYLEGKAQTALAIRKTEINMAVNGSPLAIQHAEQYLAAMTDNMII